MGKESRVEKREVTVVDFNRQKVGKEEQNERCRPGYVCVRVAAASVARQHRAPVAAQHGPGRSLVRGVFLLTEK